jgi:hypothetical protein
MVDRDMFMRYLGGGIGHQLPRNTTDLVEKDADWEDIVDDEHSAVVENEPEPNGDVDKNDETEQGNIVLEEEGAEKDEDIEEVRDSDEEEDYGYQSQGEVKAEEDEDGSDEQSGCEDDGLGAEDGEDADDLDDDGEYDTL